MLPLFAEDYVNKLASVITFVEFLDAIVKGLEILMIFLDILFVLFQVDEIFGCLTHGYDRLLTLVIVEIDCLQNFP